MTIGTWLDKSIEKLKKSNIETAVLDSEVLLSDALDVDRSWIQTHRDNIIMTEQVSELDTQIQRRARYEPLAYIRGKQEFYRRDFTVSADTLTPRPETETMLELLLNSEFIVSNKNSDINIVDVGTGTGCIIISIACELAEILNLKTQTLYLGLDISNKALKIANQNAKKLKADVLFKKFNLMTDSIIKLTTPNSKLIITANLPYVPDGFMINKSAQHEPGLAIYGGKDGLDYYRQIFKYIKHRENTLIYTEALLSQHQELEEIANQAGFKLLRSKDLIQEFSI